jgi:ATP-dependent exoDNAse (exonuclease V) beta subunit
MGPDPLTLQEALRRQIDGELLREPSLQRLSALSDPLLTTTMPAAVDLVITVAGLKDWVARMADPEQEEADLLRLRAEAHAFDEAHRDLRSSSGFHGQTLKVFLGWLDSRKAERDFDHRPDPSGNSAQAVEIVTWHASKGREWPITVVAEFDNDIEERPGTTSTSFRSFDLRSNTSAPLASAELVHTPVMAAPEIQRRFIEDRRKDFEANARNLLYVAMTRARDRIILEWPMFLSERKNGQEHAKCLFHVLEDTCSPSIATGSLTIAGVGCPARIIDPPDQAMLTEYRALRDRRSARFGRRDPLPSVHVTPWRLQPSAMTTAIGDVPSVEDFTIGPRWPVGPSDAERGTSIHLALRTCLTRPDLAQNLPDATGLDEKTLASIRERADSLKKWLSSSGFDDIRCEIPFVEAMPGGTEIGGTIDLLATGPKGCLLIDHKTGGPGEGLGAYWPQLSAYVKIFPQIFPDRQLTAVGIFWIDHGQISVANL